MHTRTALGARLSLVFGGCALVATPAPAQQPPAQLVEITGSAIKRIDAETAVPVTVLQMEDLKRAGVTTAEQALQQITALQTSTTTSQVIGTSTGGASFADLRGIGPNKTLVLLNGRRVANNAFTSSGVDINTIPFAAIERVEVLRDGASALYGTDAIGGVINFITRQGWRGGTATLGADIPQHAGAKAYSVNAGYGFGDLARERYNLFAFVDAQHQDALRGLQRPFGLTGKVSPTTFPGTYSQGNLAVTPGAPACSGRYLAPGSATTCTYNTNLWVDYLPRSERISGLVRGELQLGADHRLALEVFAVRSSVDAQVAPVPLGGIRLAPGTPFFPGNGITPAPPAGSGFDPTLPISVRFRDEPNGPRVNVTDNRQQRALLSLEGTLAGWDYKAGASYNQNKIDDQVGGGYTDGDVIAQGISAGIVNPFGPQTAAGQALLQGAYVKGTLQTAAGYVSALDARASRDLGDWFGSGEPAALAVGAEVRREKFVNVANAPVATQVQASTGVDPATDNQGRRRVAALYAELVLHPLRSLELSAALRHDRYSDFGSTTNPKLSFRFQPSPAYLLRGAYSTGFRAPSLYELNQAQVYTFTADPLNDPLRCPGGHPIGGVSAPDNCKVQFIALLGGNQALQPEKARNGTLGIVLQPNAAVTLGADFWWLRVKNQISTLTDVTVFDDPAKYAGLFHRAPDGSLSTDGSQCPGANCGYVDLLTNNLGGVMTRGVDLSASWRLQAAGAGLFQFAFNASYVARYAYQREPGGAWIENVGQFPDNGPVFRWQDTLTATWSRGAWSAGWSGHFKSGYRDQNPNGQDHRVAANVTMDAYGGWRPTKAVALVAGVRNLLDRDPPYSNQGVTFQQGYDPRYADPVGRAFYVRASYAF